MTASLAGLKVLDFSTLLPGPLATLLLAEAGAEVLKIEPPGGDEMRRYLPHWGRDSAAFALLNRGKQSLVLDLKTAAGRERALELAAGTDILVEQFRPGVMRRLGLGYEALSARRPDLVYCSITGYGQHGPYRDRAGHDLNYIGDTGLLALGSGDPTRPTPPPALIADIAGGAYPAVMNILLALRQRERHGRGRHLDISMTDNLFPLLFWAQAEGQSSGRWPGSHDALLTGGSPRYQLYPTADAQLLAVAALEDRFWRRFTELIGLPLPLRDDRRDPEATRAAVAARVAGRSAADWRPLLEAADCCCSLVRTLREALDDPHFRARGVFAAGVRNSAGDRAAALPTPLAPGLKGPPEAAAPGLNESGEA